MIFIDSYWVQKRLNIRAYSSPEYVFSNPIHSHICFQSSSAYVLYSQREAYDTEYPYKPSYLAPQAFHDRYSSAPYTYAHVSYNPRIRSKYGHQTSLMYEIYSL